MAFSPSSIDSGYVTGGAESRGGHLDGDIDGLGSRKRGLQSAESTSTKGIAPWIHPIIQGLCNELGAPAAVPHILAGVTTILTLPSPPPSNYRGKNDKTPALIAALYFYVRTKLSGRETSGQEYGSQRNRVLSTLAKLKEDQTRYVAYKILCNYVVNYSSRLPDSSVHQKDKTEVYKEPTSEGVEWEGWEKVRAKDVDAWLVEISEAHGGWVKLDWFKKIVEGAGLKDLPKSKQIARDVAPKVVNSKKADKKVSPSSDAESDEEFDESADDADSDESDEYSESAPKKRKTSTATSKRAPVRSESSDTQPKLRSFPVRFPTHPIPSTQLTENIRKGNVMLRSPSLARYINPQLFDSA
jgi:hypothetical protein